MAHTQEAGTSTEQIKTKKSKKKASKHLEVPRIFSTQGVHPYDEVVWEKRDVEQTNWATKEVVFSQKDVEFPSTWSMNASTIVTTKYFRGALGTPEREHSLKQVIDRVAKTYAAAGVEHGYFTKNTAKVFEEELTWLLLNQYFSFNSPVWFNVGTKSSQQVSACFILSVEDSMDSILDWYKEEGFIFKGGSGAGVNLSKIRSSKELLSSGGNASGPVSFMRGADASAGTIKSGGATRRAAKMVVLDVDHPDIEEFIETKAHEEKKIRALREAGFDMELGGKDSISVQYQNANNSVRVTDEFMRAVEAGAKFGLTSRTTGEVVEEVDAKELFRKISVAAWECADPGVQYDGAIQKWHTNSVTGRITASNPCSEFLSLDNSACNLASLNLMKFLGDDGEFDTEKFMDAVNVIITAMEISIAFGDFPTAKITEGTKDFRQLGIGYANLGALLMATGHAYDSPRGRAVAAAITAVMTATAYRRSAEIAAVMGAYAGYAANKQPHDKVMRQHAEAAKQVLDVASNKGAHYVAEGVIAPDGDAAKIAAYAPEQWDKALALGDSFGYRNSQISLLAPTGTIGFMMDCDTTGIEPDFSLLKFKKLVGGGSMQIVNRTVPAALLRLGYSQETIDAVVAHITEHGHVVGAPGLAAEHYPVFDCAVGSERQIKPMGHVLMMAAVQPSLSGAISKTVNLPEEATVEDIENVYMQSWKLGLKATAVYRDNCKVGQPLSSSKTKEKAATPDTPEVKVVEIAKPTRRRLPKSRAGKTTSFNVGGADGYLTTGQHESGELGEVFLKLGKQGSTLAGVMDAFSIAVSIGLQYGVPLETFVSKFTNQRFEPAGMTDDPDIRMAQSILDYVFRRLALDHLPFDERAVAGIYTAEERKRHLETGSYEAVESEAVAQDEVAPEVPTIEVVTPVDQAPKSSAELMEKLVGHAVDSPLCMTCGVKMRPSGSCYVCEGCGSTSGCS